MKPASSHPAPAAEPAAADEVGSDHAVIGRPNDPSSTKINQLADEKIVRLPDELQTASSYPRSCKPGREEWHGNQSSTTPRRTSPDRSRKHRSARTDDVPHPRIHISMQRYLDAG